MSLSCTVAELNQKTSLQLFRLHYCRLAVKPFDWLLFSIPHIEVLRCRTLRSTSTASLSPHAPSSSSARLTESTLRRCVLIWQKVSTVCPNSKVPVSLVIREINPVEEVPVIVDGTLKLFESHAILSYLACAKPGVPDHWYPRELSARAKINSVLDWHHCHLRRGALSFVLGSKLALIMNLNWKPLGLAEAEELLTVSLSRIESFWLDGKGKFLLGNSQPSIADLSLVCELMQLQVVDDKDRERILGPYRNVLQWMEDVKNATNPHFDEFHETLFKFKATLQSKQS